MEGLCGLTRSLIGQPWSSWSATKELECEEETPECEKSKPTADVMRLPKEDMTLFGFCPEQDDFYIVICELCGLGIKPMGMNHHMSLRHSNAEETTKAPIANKTLSKECDAKPKNRKHSSASIVSEYGHGVGPPPKLLASEAPPISVGNSEQHKEASHFVAPNNLKVKLEPDKVSKLSNVSKNHCKQYSYQDSITAVNSTSNTKLSMMKISRSSISSNVENVHSPKTAHKPAVPIKSGFRLQLVGTSNCIVFNRNSKSVLNSTSELKVRHRRKHRRNRMSHKSKMKAKAANKFLPVVLKSSSTSSPVVAMSPALAPSPYVALTPLKAVKWNNNVEGVPSHLKPSSSSHPSGVPGLHMASMMHPQKSSDVTMQILTVDTSRSNGLKSESRMPLLMCKSLPPVRNHLEFNSQNQIQGNGILVSSFLPHSTNRMPDVAWSTVHPKPLGVCPLQTRKVGGLITSDRRLDCVWQSMKSALLEQEAYQTTLLCSSSQPDFHMNHKSSIKTILANLSTNNCTRNAVCKQTNLGPRPLGIINDKPHSSSLRGIIDTSSSVMLISSHHTKILANPHSFLANAAKENPHAKHSPNHITTQPFPGIFLRNGRNILPRNLRICLKRRKSMGGFGNGAKKIKSGDLPVESCRNGKNDQIFSKCIPVLQFSLQNGVSEPVNNYMTYTEEEMKKVLHQGEILLDVVNSMRRDKVTTNGETSCEKAGRLSMFDQLKSDLMTRFQNIKSASRIVDVSNKTPCRKVAPTALPNVRITSAPGTFQVSSPKITYLKTGPVTFQQISPQMGQIQLQSKSNQTAAPIPLKFIGPAQTVSLTASRTLLLNSEKDES